MDTFIPILALALVAAILASFLKASKMPAMATLLTMAVGALILLQLLPRLGEVVDVFSRLGEEASLNELYLSIILKIIAVTYIGEFTAQICRDAGQGAMAAKIDLAAKVMIIMMAVPIIAAILDGITKILS